MIRWLDESLNSVLVTGLTSEETLELAQLVGDRDFNERSMSMILTGTRVIALLQVPVPAQNLDHIVTALQDAYGSSLVMQPFGVDNRYALITRAGTS